MIKKMLAMLVAISCAVGAWADTHLSGTDFSALNVGSFVLGLDDEGNDTGTNYWYNGDTSDFEGSIVTDGVGKFLDFESNITNPLYRTINNCYEAESVSELPKRSIGTGLFIDTYVQFTPYLVNDNHPAPSAVTDDDKLIVWVREIEVENDANLTNLIVTAGYYNNFDEVSESNYVVTNLSPAEIATLCSTTNRLTIKSFSSITGEDDAPAGFVVYINKKSLEYAADAFSGGSYVGNHLDTTPAAYYEPGRHRLFPSLMAGDQTNHDKLSGVGYAGMGKIGEVWFDDYSTDYPDFAGDDHNITIVKGEGVVSYVYNNITYTEDYSTAVSVPTVTISNVVYNTSAGYQHKTGTWYIGSQVVNNTSTADGDIGTFDLANGNRLVLAGFKANYLVGGFEYQSLFGIEPTETTGAYNAAKSGGTIKLNKDILIDEGTHKQIVVGEDDDLTIDLNGHTLRGTSAEVDEPSIVNNLGTLTIIDTSDGQTGKVLGCLSYDSENDEWINNYKAIKSTGIYVVSNALTAGTYELIITDVDADKFVISGGSYICPHDDEEHPEIQPAAFYLASYLAPGATVTSWTQDPVTEFWYANVGGSAPTTYAVTFSTNSVTVAEYTTNITAGATLPNAAIPAFTGGAWDIDPTGAVISAATNFNYTIAVQLSYFPQSTIEEQWADRDGTAAKPFVVRNLADLYGLQDDIKKGYNIDKCFEQVADIDLDGEAAWTGIGAFKKTAAGAGAFEGTYDGGNHVISNVTIASAEYAGLFNSTVGAVIKNLTVNVAGIETTAAEYGMGAFVGTARDCFFTNLVATGTIGTEAAPANHSVGGLFVRLEGSVAYACTNRCEIWCSKGKLGGIAAMGQNNNRDYFIFCSNEGVIHNKAASITANEGGVGGIIGYPGYGTGAQTQYATITDCRSVGAIYSDYPTSVGSFIGWASGSNDKISISGTNIALDNMRVVYNADVGVTYGKSIGGGLVELCTQAAFETNNTYSTMWSGLTPTFEFSAPGTISFNTNLFQATAFAITATGIDVTESESGGIVTFTAGSSDPWAPAAETDEAAAAKAAELFGAESEVAANVDTLAEYNALVTYIKSVTSQSEVPTDLTADEKTWMWKSFILGANPLFDEEPAVQITSLTAGATAGLWDFTVKVTEGDDTDAYNVAADKVGALVKISSSLTSGTWVAPTAGNISAVKLLGGNLIQVEVNFGAGTSGFMKVSE